MARRSLAPLLAFGALVADIGGAHGVASMVLLLAIPAAFAFGLDQYRDSLAGRCGGARPALAAGGLALLVFSAALRSPAVVGGVPRLAVTAVVLSLLLYAASFVAGGRRRSDPVAVPVVDDRELRDAA